MAQSYNDTLDEFLDQGYDLGELDTKISVVPQDTVSRGTVVGIRPIKYQNDEGEWNALVEMMYSLNDPEIKESTQLDDPRVTHTFRVDIADKNWDGNGLIPLASGPNKNVELGKVLKAFRLNGKPWKWSSFKNEEACVRVGRPRREEDRYAPVVAVGLNEDDVKSSSKKR